MALASFRLARQVEVGSDVYVFKLGSNCNASALAVATSEHTLCVLDPETLQIVRRLEGHGDAVEDLEFFQSQTACLASCSHDGSARVWDLRASEAGARRFAVAGHEVYSCSIGRGDGALACAASEKVHLFDVGEGKRVRVYNEIHTDVVNHVRFHPVDTSKLLSGAEDNLVVVVDTNQSSADDAMLACIPNEECVRSFTLVGPDRSTLCCASTTEDVRIWGLGANDCGTKKAEFLGLRDHPLLAVDESSGYVVETFYDQPSAQVFLLAGTGSPGNLVLFRVTVDGVTPAAVFSAEPLHAGGAAESPLLETGHVGIVRSALCLPNGALVTAGEDGRICAWREGESHETGQLALEPSAYGASRRNGSVARATPY